MSESKPQSFKSHGRFDPPYHFVLGVFLLANLLYASVHMYRHWAGDRVFSAWFLVMSLVAFIPFVKLRSYPLRVQDRVIRLEERIRLQALAPSDWHKQIYSLTEDQLIGLRFAADDEVVDLAKKALEGNLNRKQIKERIKNWRADFWRV